MTNILTMLKEKKECNRIYSNVQFSNVQLLKCIIAEMLEN